MHITLTAYQRQLDEKLVRLRNMLSEDFQGDIDVFTSPEKHYRMRCEFRVWHQGAETFHIMFDQTSKEKYRVDQFSAASGLINEAMLIVMKFVHQHQALRHKLYQVDYLSTLSGELIVSLIYRKPIEANWYNAADKLKRALNSIANSDIIGRARKQKIMLNNDFVTEILRVNGNDYKFKQVENSFTQPNAAVNIKMITWAMEQASKVHGDLLELYCGAGNFTIPLASKFGEVLATEISKSSVAAALANIENNNAKNVNIVRLSSEEFSQAYLQQVKFKRLAGIELSNYEFSTVLVDPPRAGLDPLTLKLITHFDNIIYISCNPNTLVDNVATLRKTHKIKNAALFDQFPYTSHIESGIFLQKIP